MASDSEQDGESIDDKLQNLEDKKTNDKFIKILTVLGYVICVSSAGIMLSLYYIFLWDPYSTMATAQALTASGEAYGTLTKECSKHIQRAQKNGPSNLPRIDSQGTFNAPSIYQTASPLIEKDAANNVLDSNGYR